LRFDAEKDLCASHARNARFSNKARSEQLSSGVFQLD